MGNFLFGFICGEPQNSNPSNKSNPPENNPPKTKKPENNPSVIEMTSTIQNQTEPKKQTLTTFGKKKNKLTPDISKTVSNEQLGGKITQKKVNKKKPKKKSTKKKPKKSTKKKPKKSTKKKPKK